MKKIKLILTFVAVAFLGGFSLHAQSCSQGVDAGYWNYGVAVSEFSTEFCGDTITVDHGWPYYGEYVDVLGLKGGETYEFATDATSPALFMLFDGATFLMESEMAAGGSFTYTPAADMDIQIHIYEDANCGIGGDAHVYSTCTTCGVAPSPVVDSTAGAQFTVADVTGQYPDYENNLNPEELQFSVCPDAPTERVTVTFTAGEVEDGWDDLYAYSGADVANIDICAPPVGIYTGDMAGISVSAAADGDCLFFSFDSDSGIHPGGLEWITTDANSPCALSCPGDVTLTTAGCDATVDYTVELTGNCAPQPIAETIGFTDGPAGDFSLPFNTDEDHPGCQDRSATSTTLNGIDPANPCGTFPVNYTLGGNFLTHPGILTFAEGGTLTFDWEYTTGDMFGSFWDPAGYVHGAAGGPLFWFQVTSNNLVQGETETGSVSIDVLPGETFTIAQVSDYFTGTGTFTVSNLVFTQYAQPGVEWVSGPQPGETLTAGTYPVEWTATLADGSTDTCNFDVIVNAIGGNPLACPTQPIVKMLGAGECSTIVDYSSVLGTACSTTLVSGPQSGEKLPIGDYTVVLQATDGAGNTYDCTFDINVMEFAGSVNYTCNSNLQVVLDDQCEAVLDADQFLEGSYGCYDNFEVSIIQPGTGQNMGGVATSAMIGSEWDVMVMNTTGTPNPCWAHHITFVDMMAPTINCAGGSNVNPLSGSLTAGSPTFNRPFTIPCVLSGIGTNVYYAATNFTVVTAGTYTFAQTYTGDGYGLIYDGSFNPNDGCANLLALNDDGNGGLDALITVDLPAGDYVLVTSTYSNGSTGNYSWTVNGPADLDFGLGGTDGFFTITCEDDITTAILDPVAADNCSATDVLLMSEQTTDDDICTNGGMTIVRTYRAKDLSNGLFSEPCTQTITITRPNIVFPENIVWTCDQWAAYPGIIDATELHSAISDSDTNDGQDDIDVNPNTPNNILGNTGSGVPSGWDGQFCKYNVAPPVDQIVEHCGGTKIYRTWSVFNECTGGEPQTHTQVIIVEDKVAPTMDFSAFDNDNGTIYYQVSTENAAQYPNYCTSTSDIKLPAFADNCAGVDMSSLQIFTAAGQAELINGYYFIPAPGLTVGTYDLTYRIADICGNIREMTIEMRVVDDIAPTMVCDQITKVSLSNNGLGKLFANNPDDGSHDNCAIDHFEIRRMSDNCGINGNTTFNDVYDNGEYVTFCCDDIGSTNTVVVRGYDVYGNYGECMVDVLVEDKIAPKCTAPADVVVDCNMYDPSFWPYGTATAWDNCSATLTGPVISGGVDACNTGTVYRTWTATDPAGLTATCTQKITVNYVEDFKVKFPNDQLSDVCNALSDTIFPTFIDKDCELAGYSYYDEKINVVPDACFKILRHWNIYDWCDFDENYVPVQVANPDYTTTGPTVQATAANHGRFSYTQIIKVIDNDAPTVTCLPADGLCNVATGCYSNVTLKAEATDACSRDNIIFGYTLYLDTDGDGTMETVIDDDTPGAYLISVAHPDGIKAVASIQVNGLNFANHKIKWYAKDGCGNIDQCEYEFETKDCKPPTILVDNGSAVNLMPVLDGNGTVTGGMIRVWPGNPANCNLPDPNVCGWDPSVGDNCTSDALLLQKLRIRRIYPGVPTPTTPPTGLYVDFTCADVGSQQVQIWTSDEAGNWAYTETYILIEDPDLICAPGAPIAGALTTEAGSGVQDADVTVADAAGNIPSVTVTTPASGEYSVNGLPLNTDYTVTPVKDGTGAVVTNGVNVIDLLRIYQAILGNTFTSTYQELAADVNGDGEVNISDLLIIRNLTLGKIDKFPNMTAWRFFEEGCNTATSDCQVIDVVDLQNAVTDANFIGVKMGDVAAPFATPNQYASVDDRSYGEFVLNTADRMINAGEEVEVTLHANRNDIAGYQFTLELGGLEFVGVNGENVSFENNFAYHNDAITVSWNGERVSDDVFTITLRATNDVRLSEALSLDGRITEAMAADTDAMRQDVKLAFDGKVVDQFTLFQNEPNPFSDRTDIQFYLPEATSATLTVYDASGRTLKTVNGDYAKGMNTISVAKSDLNVAGVLYYKLETASNSAIRKMIIME